VNAYQTDDNGTRHPSLSYQINADTRLVIGADQVQIQDRGHMTNLDHGEARELAETILADLAARHEPEVPAPWFQEGGGEYVGGRPGFGIVRDNRPGHTDDYWMVLGPGYYGPYDSQTSAAAALAREEGR
jgi:hypothetical protein